MIYIPGSSLCVKFVAPVHQEKPYERSRYMSKLKNSVYVLQGFKTGFLFLNYPAKYWKSPVDYKFNGI